MGVSRSELEDMSIPTMIDHLDLLERVRRGD
jgi:hypothetical protein